MFKSFYFPNGWNGDNRFIGYLDKKDFEKVKDLQNNLSGSKFMQSNVISISISDNEVLRIDNFKNLRFEFKIMKFTKGFFDKLYVPYIQRYQPDKESKLGQSYYFVDDLSQAHYINTYPTHLHSNIIQFSKFMLGKKDDKLSKNEIKELHDVSGFLTDTFS